LDCHLYAHRRFRRALCGGYTDVVFQPRVDDYNHQLGPTRDRAVPERGVSQISEGIVDKDYIGDGVYIGLMDGGLVLTTEDGISVTNIIWLDPDVFLALVRYARRKGLPFPNAS
jgi:hypothetical protein